MGGTQLPLSEQSQILSQTVASMADGSGNASFTFTTPPAGFTWTGTLTCASAPISAVFVATVGAVSWGDWGGDSVYGPVQVMGQGSQQLIVTATGLTAGVSYTLQWNGSSDPSSLVAAVWPDVTTSALQATISGTVQVTSGVDLLASLSPPLNIIPASPSSYVFTATCLNDYQALGVLLLSGNIYNTAISVTFQNLRTNQVVTVTQGYNSLDYSFQAQVFCSKGDSIQITILSSLNVMGPIMTDFVNVYGYTVSPLVSVQNVPNVSLDVVPYGGAQSVSATLATGTSTTFLGTTGLMQRIQSVAAYMSNPNTVIGTISFLDHKTGNAFCVLSPENAGTLAGVHGASEQIGGTLMSLGVGVRSGVDVVNNTNRSFIVSVFYDLVSVPSIS